jgi:polar amino acid transport system substrate-binding protein
MKLKQLIVIITFFFIYSVYAQERVRILIGDYPPFIDQTADNDGIMTEIVKSSLDSQGIEYEIEFASWTRAEDALNSKNAISFAYVKNKKRLEQWYFSSPIIQAPTIFVKHTNSDIDLEELDDLKKYRVGVSRNYSYGEKFEKIRSQLDIEVVSSDLMNMKKIYHRRIDLFPIPLYNAIYYMRENFSREDRDKFEFVFYPSLNNGNMHLVCHKSYPRCLQIIKSFNKGMSKVTQEGLKDRIISTYLTWK